MDKPREMLSVALPPDQFELLVLYAQVGLTMANMEAVDDPLMLELHIGITRAAQDKLSPQEIKNVMETIQGMTRMVRNRLEKQLLDAGVLTPDMVAEIKRQFDAD